MYCSGAIGKSGIGEGLNWIRRSVWNQVGKHIIFR